MGRTSPRREGHLHLCNLLRLCQQHRRNLLRRESLLAAISYVEVAFYSWRGELTRVPLRIPTKLSGQVSPNEAV
ncbi:hypothetical protein ACFX1R_006411 [Malus domestica]